MFYRLLGLAVWKGAKLLLRQKYGSLYAPKALVAGGVLAAVAGAVALVLRRDGSDD
jgi:hypothetical protein